MVVRNRSSAARPVRAAQVHMLHPNLDLDEETLTCMTSNAVNHPISNAYYDDKIEEYYAISGVALHHILIATQSSCVVCGSLSKPEACKMKTVILYSSLTQEPRSGTVMPTRCTNRTCRLGETMDGILFLQRQVMVDCLNRLMIDTLCHTGFLLLALLF